MHSRPLKKKRKARPQPLSNGKANFSDAMTNSKQPSASESPLTVTKKPEESDFRYLRVFYLGFLNVLYFNMSL